LFALACNLGNFLRRLALPKPVRHWSLTTLREKLIKIGAKVTRHSNYVTFQLAEVAVTRNLFAAILNRIARWRRKLLYGSRRKIAASPDRVVSPYPLSREALFIAEGEAKQFRVLEVKLQ